MRLSRGHLSFARPWPARRHEQDNLREGNRPAAKPGVDLLNGGIEVLRGHASNEKIVQSRAAGHHGDMPELMEGGGVEENPPRVPAPPEVDLREACALEVAGEGVVVEVHERVGGIIAEGAFGGVEGAKAVVVAGPADEVAEEGVEAREGFVGGETPPGFESAENLAEGGGFVDDVGEHATHDDGVERGALDLQVLGGGAEELDAPEARGVALRQGATVVEARRVGVAGDDAAGGPDEIGNGESE